MRVSKFFLPTLKEAPVEAELISHQLMLRAGLIRQLGSGLYTWLPLGLRVLRKVENIVREEMDAAGAIELLMPAIQPAELWQESGRWELFGPQMLKIKDRRIRIYHDQDLLITYQQPEAKGKSFGYPWLDAALRYDKEQLKRKYFNSKGKGKATRGLINGSLYPEVAHRPLVEYEKYAGGVLWNS